MISSKRHANGAEQQCCNSRHIKYALKCRKTHSFGNTANKIKQNYAKLMKATTQNNVAAILQQIKYAMWLSRDEMTNCTELETKLKTQNGRQLELQF